MNEQEIIYYMIHKNAKISTAVEQNDINIIRYAFASACCPTYEILSYL